MFPEGKAGLSIKVIAGIMIALVYSMGMINVTTQTESEGEHHIRSEVKDVKAEVKEARGEVKEVRETQHTIDNRLTRIETHVENLVKRLDDQNKPQP
jgi:predicted nuclease with TOPRIM domain